MIAIALHSSATGNLLPFGVITNAHDFLHVLRLSPGVALLTSHCKRIGRRAFY